MTNKEALLILKKYNKWRVGDDFEDMPELGDITRAINFAIKELSKNEAKN